jgi:putative GTP pyrophosphokinase
MPKQFDKRIFRNSYEIRKPRFTRLAEIIKEALEVLLQENKIQPQYISYRIKTFESFWDKIRRKGYESPFVQTTDLCGLRIVTFFEKDVDEIASIIQKEFMVHETVHTKDTQEVDRFGYRDDKYIVSVMEDWLRSPIYRGLELHNLKAEIQVRSILTHAWAELSHKLVYKKTEGLPDDIVREISRASALLEELDKKFDNLRLRKESYQIEILQKARTTPEYWKSLPLNADTLQAFLNQFFSNRRTNDFALGSFLEELFDIGIKMEDLVENIEKAEDEVQRVESTNHMSVGYYSQIDALRIALLGKDLRWMKRELERIWEEPSAERSTE